MASSPLLAPNSTSPAHLSPSLSPLPLSYDLRTSPTVPHDQLLQYMLHRRRMKLRSLRCGGSKGNNAGSGGSGGGSDKFSGLFANGNSEIESPVPHEQQPINEYQSLLDSVYFSWAVEDVWRYGLKLGAVGACFTLLLGWPVAAASVNPEQEFWKCGMGAVCGGIMGTTLSALRLYLGWAYVGNRLFSATVEYEETGWYDGQFMLA